MTGHQFSWPCGTCEAPATATVVQEASVPYVLVQGSCSHEYVPTGTEPWTMLVGSPGLTAILDQRLEPWDLYRTHDKRWCVRLGSGPNSRSVSSMTVEGALAAAVEAGPPLPVVPRRPPAWGAESMWVEKTGSGAWPWQVLTPGGWTNGFRTKRDATAAIPGIARRLARAVADWDAEHGPTVAGKTEGVDFRWREW